MLNQSVITGNLGDDPKIYFSPDGVPVTSFDIAFQAAKKKTCWIRVVAFNKLAEVCGKYLKKGNRIAVSGILDQSKWTDKEGNNHATFQILLNTIEFIRIDESVFKDGATAETINDDVPF